MGTSVQREIILGMGYEACRLDDRSRQARLNAPGALHHVIGRRIEGISIFRIVEDHEGFLKRLGALCEPGAWGLKQFERNAKDRFQHETKQSLGLYHLVGVSIIQSAASS